MAVDLMVVLVVLVVLAALTFIINSEKDNYANANDNDRTLAFAVKHLGHK